jgi:hypothetical protein
MFNFPSDTGGMKDKSHSHPNASFGEDERKNHHLIAELSAMARNPKPQRQGVDKAKADANWAKVKHQPIVMLITLLGLSLVGSIVCFGSGASAYIGVFIFAVVLILAVTNLNNTHKSAYVERQILRGVSRQDAERDYSDRYSS